MTTTNMLMDLPVVGVTLDPLWATKLNTALTDRVDEHDHTTGFGVQVPTAGININADLSLQSNDLTHIRSLSLNNNVSTLPVGDVRALYASNGNLYYNNNSGVAIQLTTGTSLNTGALALNVWSLIELAGNLTIPSNAVYSFINVDTSAARSIVLPAANAVTAGRYFIIKDKSGSAATNNIGISAAGSDTIDLVASKTISSNFSTLTVVSDGVSFWSTGAEIGGSVTLGGDLLGTGSTSVSPRVGHLTGVSGVVQMNNNTGLYGKNLAGSTDVALAKVNTSDQVVLGDASNLTIINGTAVRLLNSIPLVSRNSGNTVTINLAKVTGANVSTYGDTAYDTKVDGYKLTLQSASDNIVITSGSNCNVTANGFNVDATSTTISVSGAAGFGGATSTLISSTAGTVTTTGQTGITTTATTGDLTLTATTGTATLKATAGTAKVLAPLADGYLQAKTGIKLVSDIGTTLVENTSADVSIQAGDELIMASTGDTTVTCLANYTTNILGAYTQTGQWFVPLASTSSSSYTIDSGTKNLILLCDTTSNAISVNLPAATTGRVLFIKDIADASVHNITLVRNGGTGNIEGTAASYVISTAKRAVQLVANAGSWWIVSTT